MQRRGKRYEGFAVKRPVNEKEVLLACECGLVDAFHMECNCPHCFAVGCDNLRSCPSCNRPVVVSNVLDSGLVRQPNYDVELQAKIVDYLNLNRVDPTVIGHVCEIVAAAIKDIDSSF